MCGGMEMLKRASLGISGDSKVDHETVALVTELRYRSEPDDLHCD